MTNVQKQQLNKLELRMCINGDLDASAIAYLRQDFDLLARSSCDIQLEFSNVPFIDSSGVGAIVFLFKRMRVEHRDLKIIGAQGQPLKLLHHLRVDRTIDINKSLS